MTLERFHPIGTPGQPWGETERAQWRAAQVRRRSYAGEVVEAIGRLHGHWDVQAYGELDYAPDFYPLLAHASALGLEAGLLIYAHADEPPAPEVVVRSIGTRLLCVPLRLNVPPARLAGSLDTLAELVRVVSYPRPAYQRPAERRPAPLR